MMKKYSSKSKMAWLLLVISVCLGMNGVTVSAEYWVQDDAQLFSDSEIQKMESLSEEIQDQYQMNVLVMTCEDADGKESNEVLEEAYEEYGLAENDARGGIALMIDMDNRELNLVTERDMIYYITDYREEQIYDAGQTAASDGEYGKAMIAMLRKTKGYLEDGIPDDQYTFDIETGKIVRYHSLSAEEVLIAFMAALAVAGIVTIVLYRSYTVVKKYKYSVQQNARIHITAQQDRLVNQFVTHRRIERESSGGGGSDSGRTSTHTSSGGHTYGGGKGRGF